MHDHTLGSMSPQNMYRQPDSNWQVSRFFPIVIVVVNHKRNIIEEVRKMGPIEGQLTVATMNGTVRNLGHH